MTDIWRDEALVREFLKEYTRQQSDELVLRRALYHAYRRFFRGKEDNYFLAMSEFERWVKESGVKQDGKYWVDLSLTPTQSQARLERKGNER